MLFEFQVEEHKAGFQWILRVQFQKCAFLLLGFIQRFEPVLFIEMQGLFVVVSVNDNKTASGFIVERAKPTFEEVENLTADIKPFASIFGRNPQTTDKDSGIVHSSLGICDAALQTIAGRPCDKLRLDAVVSQSYQP